MAVERGLRNVHGVQDGALQVRFQGLAHSLRALHQELALLRAGRASAKLRNIAHAVSLRVGHHNGGTNTFKKIHS